MPWTTPPLKDVRRLVRDYVLAQVGGVALVPNSVLRIMSDAMAGLTHLTLLYLDWLAKQLMPDTAEQEWLDRHGQIWLVNADGSKGRKAATYAQGQVQFTGGTGIVIPIGALMTGGNGVQYQTITAGEIGADGFGSATAVSLTAGRVGNLPDGDVMSLSQTVPGIDTAILFGDMAGGFDTETDDQLRERILFRIQNPPMGGDLADYVAWATAVPGVTRAWAACEIGPGTMTVRFLMDDTYPDNHGLPQPADVDTVSDYIDSKRPVTVKDCFVMAPILSFYDITISSLTNDDPTVRARIEQSITDMEFKRSKPGQTMYRSWVDEAISQAVGEETHELDFETTVMPAPAYMPTLGTVLYA
ncbi:baseplate J/gp47 family protein [Bradyrhizobium septentrionale]|uniref:Baseplate J/gp47 family protein n=1 Tax=Bradyrhizobium septentrionale TaxID=1404411 RepID=A0A974A257_9BRAD|nr:baseplate J/gp47 family protein [Bradyrhizobium septentrionale]UGY13732.1 baseplate J/gp47 family protein [Bradyrhizobium septentrionale]